jgi:hypothetical protein
MYSPHYKCQSATCDSKVRAEMFCDECTRKINGMLSWFNIMNPNVCRLYTGTFGCENPKPGPMTLERAVEILNARKHLEVEWFAKPMNQFRSIADSRKGHRAEFEAIAIAEKYERESK